MIHQRWKGAPVEDHGSDANHTSSHSLFPFRSQLRQLHAAICQCVGDELSDVHILASPMFFVSTYFDKACIIKKHGRSRMPVGRGCATLCVVAYEERWPFPGFQPSESP
uniref:Uncharacterized protein n=1 Tax=Oryza meridionalis TaxID=40149 RepID=A0A0E0DJ63_9ORYZ